MKACWPKHECSTTEGSDPRATRLAAKIVERILKCLVIFCVLLAASRSFSQGNDQPEYKVKLAFLYHFTQFVQWPGDAFRDAKAPLVVCVAGENPFQGELEQELRGRRVGEHPIEMRKFKAGDNSRECHLIFIRANERKFDKILLYLKGSNTLTVGESKGFAQRGGIINLTMENNKLGFEINVDAASQTRLRISSNLLALAKIVKSSRP